MRAGIIDRNEVVLPEVLIADFNAIPGTDLAQALDAIWQSSGFSKNPFRGDARK